MSEEKKLPEKKLKVRLIALDLDDTLLNSQLLIGERTLSVIKKAAEKGIYIVLCSGRPSCGVLNVVRQMNIAGTQAGRYIISTNGTVITDLHTRLEIFHKNVPGSVLLQAHKEAKKMGLNGEVYDAETIYAPVDNKYTRMDPELIKSKFQIVEDFDSFIQHGFSKMLVAGEPAEIAVLEEKLKSLLGNLANIYTSKPVFLEILPADCGKGESLLHLAKFLGIPQEETMAFGDGMNDESMILKARYGVAMKNAKDALKAQADFVTEYTNEEDGVGRFIEDYIL